MPSEILTSKALDAKLKDALRKAAEKNTRVAISDGNNLLLIARPNGGASWVLNYRLHGKRNMHALGPWPTVGLAHARKLADAARRQLVDGIDPVQARRETRREPTEKPGDTVLNLFDEWVGKLNTTKACSGNIHNAFRSNVLPIIGAKHPSDVTRAEIISILRTIEGRGSLVMLRKVRMWMAQMFDYELSREHPSIQTSPVPAGRLKSFKMPTRGHLPAITNAADVPELMDAIRRWYRVIPRTALMMSAYTFQRPTEIREATWGEFYLDGGKWVIPAARMKERREHWVPLAPQVVAMLKAWQGVVGDEGLLFPSRYPGQAISEATVNKTLRTLGYEGKHCTHGFRAMARTIMDEVLRIDPRFIEKQLSHEHDASGLGGAYSRAAYWDDRVKAMTAWADWIDAQRVQRSSH